MSDIDSTAIADPVMTLDQALKGEVPSYERELPAQQELATEPDEATKGEKTTDATPAPESARQVPLKAYEAERDKRQAAERRLAELESNARAKELQTNAPDPLENPEGFAQHVNEAVLRETQRLRVETQQELMRARHDDYDEKEGKFLEMAQENPALLTQAAASGNVAKFAYQTVVNSEKFAEMQDVEGYEAKLRQRLEVEIRARIESELAGKQAAARKLDEATSLPSLATIGSGGVTDEAELGLDSILGGADPTKRRRR